jgi:hypothetical protein
MAQDPLAVLFLASAVISTEPRPTEEARVASRVVAPCFSSYRLLDRVIPGQRAPFMSSRPHDPTRA